MLIYNNFRKSDVYLTLKDLKIGGYAIITSVGGEGALRQHFLDMGVIPGTEVTVVKYAPMGDPMELRLHGYELTLRLADAEQIEITPINEKNISQPDQLKIKNSEHPGLGEGGKFHPKGSGSPLPDDTELTFALVGNQTAEKQLFSIALPVQINTLEISQGLQLTAKTVL